MQNREKPQINYIDRQKEEERKRDATRCPGCNHLPGHCTCPKFEKIEVTGKSAGTITININDTGQDNIKTACITYNPDSGIQQPTSMLFGYRDANGKGHQIEMTETERKPEGWVFEREIHANESTDFFLHPDTKKDELRSKPDIEYKIALKEGEIIHGVNQVKALTTEEKGTIERYVYKDQKITGPVDEKYSPHPDEKLIDIYFPAGYSQEAERKYALQVFLDGDLHLSRDPFGQHMGTQHILDNLIASRKIEPVIAVFSAPTPPTPRRPTDDNPSEWKAEPRLGEYACNCETDAFLASIQKVLSDRDIPIDRDPSKKKKCSIVIRDCYLNGMIL